MATYTTGNGNERWSYAPSQLQSNATVIYDPNLSTYRVATSADFGAAVSITGNVQIDDFIGVTGNVKTIDPPITSVSNSTVSGSNGTFLQANANRLSLFVQNLGTGVLYFAYGAGASNNVFHAVIKSDSAIDAGNGGSLTDAGWTGICSISGSFPRFIGWEKT